MAKNVFREVKVFSLHITGKGTKEEIIANLKAYLNEYEKGNAKIPGSTCTATGNPPLLIITRQIEFHANNPATQEI